MRAFARLLENLAFTPGRNARLALLTEYFAATPDPDRGYPLAALAGGPGLASVTAGRIRGMAGGGSIRCCSGWPATMSATSPRRSR